MNISRLPLRVLVFTATATHADFNARVIAITDGDTIKVLDASNTQYRIRLAGIDAPERKQAWGTRSR